MLHPERILKATLSSAQRRLEAPKPGRRVPLQARHILKGNGLGLHQAQRLKRRLLLGALLPLFGLFRGLRRNRKRDAQGVEANTSD